jgi:hypothetical protein
MSIEKLKEILEDADYFIDDTDPEVIEIIQEGDWKQEHKYQYSETIVKFEDKYYSVNQSRSGSYHSDWYYNDPDVYEVERKEEIVTKVTWPRVK